ncbi:hypothetical protein L9F63_022236, partial [Diploptera punctata]
ALGSGTGLGRETLYTSKSFSLFHISAKPALGCTHYSLEHNIDTSTRCKVMRYLRNTSSLIYCEYACDKTANASWHHK